MKLPFCCYKFEFYHHGVSSLGPNIRVIEIGEHFRLYDKHKNLRFLITNGYKVFDENTPTVLLNFCPHCGQKLDEFYSSLEYVNEWEHPFV